MTDTPRRGGISPAFRGDNMEEYMNNYFTIKKCRFFNGETVNVLEYTAEDGGVHGYCLKCGKPLKRHWWRVQTAADDAVYGDIGADCVKKLK